MSQEHIDQILKELMQKHYAEIQSNGMNGLHMFVFDNMTELLKHSIGKYIFNTQAYYNYLIDGTFVAEKINGCYVTQIVILDGRQPFKLFTTITPDFLDSISDHKAL